MLQHDQESGPWYTACPQENCNKKVTANYEGNGWHCEKCNLTAAECSYRYILSLTISDHTGQTWVSMFNETAEQLVGMPAGEVNGLREDNHEAFELAFTEACFKQGLFKLRIKNEMVREEMRVKSTVLEMVPMDYKKESEELLKAIEEYNSK